MRLIKKVVLVVSLLIYFTGVTQKVKRDKHLDSLARKIQFQYKELIFEKGSLEAIKEIANYMMVNNNHSYSIESNTCSKGKQENNQILTDKRAAMIKKILIKLGVSPSRIDSVGFGDNYPIGVHVNPEENRRIEISVIDKRKD